MKLANLILIAWATSSVTAFASPAVGYSCVGKNKSNGQAVVFDLMFSDWAREEGYTNQSITITKNGGEYELSKPQTLQMSSATAANECKKSPDGATYLNGLHFLMEPLPQGMFADYAVTFALACPGAEKLDVQAYCSFEY